MTRIGWIATLPSALISAALLLMGPGGGALAADDALAERVMRLTRATTWTRTGEIRLPFPTFHPQGMVRVGDELFVSSVDIQVPTRRFPAPQDGLDRDAGQGRGLLFRIALDGRLLATTTLGDGTMYHPGGIDFDGRHIWVPVAEYRPNSRSIVYRVDPATMAATEMFRFADHLGGLVHDSGTGTLHAVSWGSRRFYAWPLDAAGRPTNLATPPADLRVANPAQYIDYQDCHFAGQARMLCSGLNAYRAGPDAPVFRLGGLELVDLRSGRPVWQAPVELWSPSGLPMTQNPVWIELAGDGLRAYFLPDDDSSTLFIYETRG